MYTNESVCIQTLKNQYLYKFKIIELLWTKKLMSSIMVTMIERVE